MAVKTDSLGTACFADYNESQQVLVHKCVRSLEEVYQQFGFTPFSSRSVEAKDLALPFDTTVPMALWIQRKVQELFFPYKGCEISHSAACLGMVAPQLTLMADAECIATIWKGLQAIGVKDFHMCLNHVEYTKALLHTFDSQADHSEQLLDLVGKIDTMAKEAFLVQLRAMFSQKSVAELDVFYEKMHLKKTISPYPYEGEGKESFAELQTLVAMLEEYNLDSKRMFFCPSHLRRVQYYTGMIFEIFLDQQPTLGAIASGGRYDGFIGKIAEKSPESGRKLQGVGGAIDLNRLFGVLKEQLPKTVADVYIAYCHVPGKIGCFQLRAIKMAGRLRERSTSGRKIRVDLQADISPKMEKVFTYASQKGYPWVIAIMDEHNVVVKQVNTGERFNFAEDELAENSFCSKWNKDVVCV